MGTFSDWLSPAPQPRSYPARSELPDGRRAEQSDPKSRRNLPARVFLVLFLAMLVVAWTYTFGLASSDVLALAIILAAFFAVAALASVLTLRTPSWLLIAAGVVGFITAAVGVYFLIEEPEGILTPGLIPLGGGILLAELAIAAHRYLGERL